jgi:hypothetical protein
MLDMSSANRVGNGRLKCTETAIFIGQATSAYHHARGPIRIAGSRESGRNSSSWPRSVGHSRFPVASARCVLN